MYNWYSTNKLSCFFIEQNEIITNYLKITKNKDYDETKPYNSDLLDHHLDIAND